jgi:Na+-transporting NADH:ubiquinone oxidoreductase subunit NqrD
MRVSKLEPAVVVSVNLAIVIGAVTTVALRDPTDMTLLAIDPEGQKLLIGVVLLLMVLTALVFGLARIGRWLIPESREGSVAWRSGLNLLAGVAFFVLATMPIVYTVTVGPSAIRIMNNLSGPEPAGPAGGARVHHGE